MDATALTGLAIGIAAVGQASRLDNSPTPNAQRRNAIPNGITFEIMGGGGKPRPGIDRFEVRSYKVGVPAGTVGIFRGYKDGFYLIQFDDGEQYGTHGLHFLDIKEHDHLPSWMDVWKFEDGYGDGYEAFLNGRKEFNLNDPTDTYGLAFIKGWYDASKKRYGNARDLFCIAARNAYNEIVRILEQMGGSNA